MKFGKYQRLMPMTMPILLVPLVNLVLLLLIFFLFSSAFSSPAVIDINIPRNLTSDAIRYDNIILSVTSENVIYYEDQVISVKELKTRLERSGRLKRPVLIKADQRASVGRIVEIWDLCRRLGIERINIATSREK